MKKYIHRLYITLLILMGNVLLAGVSGNTNGINGASRKAALKSITQLAKIIYTFAVVIMVVTVIVGLIIGVWNTMKYVQKDNIQFDQILILWTQIFIIFFIMFSSTKIATYIVTKGAIILIT